MPNRALTTDLPQETRAFIARYDLIPPGAVVAIACSGGPDSLCLLHVLCELVASGRLEARLSVCHLDHRLRGDASRADLAFVRDEAARLSLPFHGGEADVGGRAAREKVSIEQAARDARLAFYAEAARTLAATRIATGHSADDQAETILFRVIRGTGLDGLGGMAPRRPLEARADAGAQVELVRPLLGAGRAEILAYLRAHDLAPREDPTNRDAHFTRNRIRHELLPALERGFNPRVREALVRLGEISRGATELLDGLARTHFAACLIAEEPGRVELNLPALAGLDAALELVVLRHALARLDAPRREVGLLHVQALRDLLAAGTGKWLPLPGGARASVVYDRLILERAAEATEPPPPYQLVLPVPGRVKLPDGRRISAHLEPGGPEALKLFRLAREKGFAPTAAIEMLDRDVLAASKRAGRPERLTIRCRRAGDRFTPLGAPRPKKVKDFFIDQKVPQPLRERAVVVESAGEIIWLAPHRLADRVKVTDKTRNLLLLRLDAPADEA